MSLRTLRRHMKKCGVHHVEARQKPQFYPDGSAEIVIAHLGLNGKRVAA